MTLTTAAYVMGHRARSASKTCNAFASHPTVRAHPNVPLFVGGQDHRHRLGMDRLDHRVRGCREEAVDLMRSRYRLGLGAAVTVERRRARSTNWPSRSGTLSGASNSTRSRTARKRHRARYHRQFPPLGATRILSTLTSRRRRGLASGSWARSAIIPAI